MTELPCVTVTDGRVELFATDDKLNTPSTDGSMFSDNDLLVAWPCWKPCCVWASAKTDPLEPTFGFDGWYPMTLPEKCGHAFRIAAKVPVASLPMLATNVLAHC